MTLPLPFTLFAILDLKPEYVLLFSGLAPPVADPATLRALSSASSESRFAAPLLTSLLNACSSSILAELPSFAIDLTLAPRVLNLEDPESPFKTDMLKGDVILPTTPPEAYLFMPAKFPAPNACVADFLITNSPGVSIAGTVSLLPVPGTRPPEAKPLGRDPADGILSLLTSELVAILFAITALVFADKAFVFGAKAEANCLTVALNKLVALACFATVDEPVPDIAPPIVDPTLPTPPNELANP